MTATATAPKPAQRLLLVEDSPTDVMLVEEALETVDAPVELDVADNGLVAIRMMRERLSSTSMPSLVILDLNMPGLSGFDVLKEVNEDPDLRRVPVVVMSTSAAPDDIARSYDLGARAYIVKPSRFADLVEVLDATCRFWFRTARLADSVPRA